MDTTNDLARSLITAHGADAMRIAERAADNVRAIGLAKPLDEWKRAIAELKRIQKERLA
jgi:hypothetical protein